MNDDGGGILCWLVFPGLRGKCGAVPGDCVLASYLRRSHAKKTAKRRRLKEGSLFFLLFFATLHRLHSHSFLISDPPLLLTASPLPPTEYTMPEVSSGRQRLKLAARLIEHHLSDLQLLFDKDLLNVVGPQGSQCMSLPESNSAHASPETNSAFST